MYSLPKTVQEAALILDTEIPGWYNKIKLSRLDMISGQNCILGQLFDCGYAGYVIGMARLFGEGTWQIDTRHPFEADNITKREWIDEIQLRRQSSQVEEKELTHVGA